MTPKLSVDAVSRSKESLRTWLRLLSCETVIEQRLRSELRGRFSVTLPQFDVLSELERAAEPLTMSQLSRELMVSNGNITGVIDRLEKQDYVKRSRSGHDRRIQYIELTETGTGIFKQIAKQHERWISELFSELSLEDMRDLQKLLLAARQSVAGAE